MKTQKPLKPWFHVATRIDAEERAQLEIYRDDHKLSSLNGAVRHMIRNSAK